MTKEQKFYKALQDVFIGAKIEGTSGFINLMRIKSNYYRKIEDILKKDIETALEKYPAFRDELFDKLYSFFNRYFTESGSIYFNSTPFHNNIYEKVYTDEKDVILFWKTQMLYYVKTDRIFRSLPVEFDGFKFYFDASTIENKKANEKRSLIFELKEIKQDKTVVFNVHYAEKGRVTKAEDILKELKRKHIQITEEQLERAFRVFEKQSEVDFFINKNAKAFLQEQFKLWSYQYFWDGAKEWDADRVNQLQILKSIAFKIIDFISQFEDELVKIWNKPKFVKNSNYVITLDRIIFACHSEQSEKSLKLVEKILKHNGINDQIKEWQELGIVDESFKTSDIFETDLTGKHLSKKYEHLPIDTKYFKDLELEILSQFDDLDKSLDGWLIKSENYQALNTILPKFKEKVQTIYIDPPFNLDSSDQFLYRTNYKDANWATLLENRLRIAKEWLNEKGSIFVRCDYNGNWIVRCLMDEIFGKENFRNELIISRISKQDPKVQKFNTATDSLFFYSKTDAFQFNLLFKQLAKAKAERWHAMDSQGQGQALYIFDYLFHPPKGRHWTYGQENIKQMENEKRIRIKCRKCGYIHISGSWKGCPKCKNKEDVKVEYLLAPTEIKQIDSNWTDVSGYTSNWDFQTENSEILLKRAIETASNKNDLVIDFFLGSGTTTAVAHKLGRKWIGVEMGEHFYTVVLPRMKKVLAYDKSGISKEVKEYQGGGFFKYYELEQYEEALANTVYENHDMFIAGNKSPYEQYVFLKDEKMLKALEIDYENNKVKVDLSKLYLNIDIAETLSNLTGKWIKKISNDDVEFEDGTKINIKDLDYKIIKPLIWWE
ncbi:Adenine specific DNA methylase Mod [Desulfurella multipotens]|uniref:site-specific DNA-methyltransferase (adenine-specific) n=1 Tax=Desulfurella multipotens TaxID=79269 RepID=A0A1G6Q150_9BACT|nr:site-specific DNA-methyltransferase [Desulfurella multipotens]SDC86170.1 Adenine specific DNA methylase Mod [Desulfurella multipotens]